MMQEVFLQWAQAAPLLLRGMLATLQLWLAALLIAVFVGVIWGVLRSKALRMPLVAQACDFITFILRGIPFYVQLLLAYFVVPSILNIDVPAYVAAAGALGLCSAAYISQIVRGGIDALNPCQWEAAKVLGYSTVQTLRFVIIPQAVKNIFPALTGELDQQLKSTAVFSTIGILELTGAGKNIISHEMNPIAMYTAVALLYLCLSSVLAVASCYALRRMGS